MSLCGISCSNNRAIAPCLQNILRGDLNITIGVASRTNTSTKRKRVIEFRRKIFTRLRFVLVKHPECRCPVCLPRNSLAGEAFYASNGISGIRTGKMLRKTPRLRIAGILRNGRPEP